MNKVLSYIVIGLVGVVIGLLCRPNRIERIVDVQNDTIVRIDTHIIEKPVPVERVILEYRTTTIHDTTIVNDTIYAVLPIEKKTYKGEDYLAEISGYNAILERIEVYPKTTTIVKTQTATRCNQLAIGAEIQYNGTPYIPIYLEYSHLLHKNFKMFAKVSYDIPTQLVGAGMGVQVQLGW